MGVGPVDIVIAEFPDDGLRIELVDILADLISNDTIRILDLLIVRKDADGGAHAVEIDDLGDELQQRFSDGTVVVHERIPAEFVEAVLADVDALAGAYAESE